MIFDPRHTVAFTGHRTYRDEADKLLPVTLRALYDRGYRRFLSGMAVGFDLAAAEAVLRLGEERAGVELICIVPFPEHAQRMEAAARARYDHIVQCASEVLFVSERYHPGCYALRNDCLVDNASYVVAYYDGSAGGTRYTVRRAHAARLPVENLYADPQTTFPGF